MEQVKAAATNWLKWITDKNGGDDKLCKEFTHNRCNITVGSRNLFYHTYSALGVLPESNDVKLVKKIRNSKWYLKNMFYPETMVSETGFPRHLKASSVLFYRLLNKNPDGSVKDKKVKKILDKTAAWLYKRDKGNALLEFLDRGVSPELMAKVLDKCPTELPGRELPRRDFQWQRTSNDSIHNYSDGHDCVYLLNLMIAKMDGKLSW